MSSFDRVLVANRGEIALRVMRTLRGMGLRSVAVYTSADAGSPHAAFADCALCIGDGPAADSYLSIEKLISAAQEAGAGALHPGYGFLSESAAFAHACATAGLVFIGPSPEVISLMGNKAAAKRRMTAAAVPCLPGYEGPDQDAEVLARAAASIGYPLMIKAAAGGGGKGMRLVQDAAGFDRALALARSEALAAFGSGEVILEKALVNPRHVEVQVFGDAQGQVIHLGERDCSIQRRHQKVVEEAPSPAVNAALRRRMGAAAVKAAEAIGYQGAGTVEFLLDQGGDFYFLEMNTRLQVEHPVTEMITGLDLVEMQIRVARGEALGLAQADVRFDGHAIEVRLYAEDPANGFLPQAGRIVQWQPPDGSGIRVDAGIAGGQEVTAFYDPLLAKLAARGKTREDARQRLAAALGECVLLGPVCNRDFLIEVLQHPEFAAGQAATGFISRHFPNGFRTAPSSREVALGAALLFRAEQARCAEAAGGVAPELLGWSSQGALFSCFRLECSGERVDAELEHRRGGTVVRCGSARHLVAGTQAQTQVDGVQAGLRSCRMEGQRLHIATERRIFSLCRREAGSEEHRGTASDRVMAPMHGLLLEICASEGETVAAGSRLAVVEAMKMQHEILAPGAGRIVRVAVLQGQQVAAGQLLFEMDRGVDTAGI